LKLSPLTGIYHRNAKMTMSFSDIVMLKSDMDENECRKGCACFADYLPKLLPEYCALFAQYSLFANDGKALAKRRRVKRITQLVIRLTQVVNPFSASIYAG